MEAVGGETSTGPPDSDSEPYIRFNDLYENNSDSEEDMALVQDTDESDGEVFDLQFELDGVDEEDESPCPLTASGSSLSTHDSGYEPSPTGIYSSVHGQRYTRSNPSYCAERLSFTFDQPSQASSSTSSSPLRASLPFINSTLSRVLPLSTYQNLRRPLAMIESRRSFSYHVSTQTSRDESERQPSIRVWETRDPSTGSEEEDGLQPSTSMQSIPDLLMPVYFRTGAGRTPGRGRSRSLPVPPSNSIQELGQTLRFLSDQFEDHKKGQMARRRRARSESS